MKGSKSIFFRVYEVVRVKGNNVILDDFVLFLRNKSNM